MSTQLEELLMRELKASSLPSCRFRAPGIRPEAQSLICVFWLGSKSCLIYSISVWFLWGRALCCLPSQLPCSLGLGLAMPPSPLRGHICYFGVTKVSVLLLELYLSNEGLKKSCEQSPDGGLARWDNQVHHCCFPAWLIIAPSFIPLRHAWLQGEARHFWRVCASKRQFCVVLLLLKDDFCAVFLLLLKPV